MKIKCKSLCLSNRVYRSVVCVLLASLFVFIHLPKAKALEEIYSLAYATLIRDASIDVFRNNRGGIVRLTDESSNTTFLQGTGYKQYTAEANPNWVFETFNYSLQFKDKHLYNRNDISGAYSFSKTHNNKKDAYIYGGNTISLNRLLTVGETVVNPLKYELIALFNPTIKAIAYEVGTITFAGQHFVKYGNSRTFNISANAGKRIKNVFVDNQNVLESVGKTNFEYTFANVIDYHVIAVTFEAIPPIQYSVSASALPADGGTVTGSGKYNENSNATVMANANSGYHFVKYTENNVEVSNNASYTFNVSSNINLVAVFEANQLDVNLIASPAEGGTVTGSGSYNENSSVTINAVANKGYQLC